VADFEAIPPRNKKSIAYFAINIILEIKGSYAPSLISYSRTMIAPNL